MSKYMPYSSKNINQLSVKEFHNILINLKYDFTLTDF